MQLFAYVCMCLVFSVFLTGKVENHMLKQKMVSIAFQCCFCEMTPLCVQRAVDCSCKQRIRLVETRYWPGFCKFYPRKNERVVVVSAVIKNCRIAGTIWVSNSLVQCYQWKKSFV